MRDIKAVKEEANAETQKHKKKLKANEVELATVQERHATVSDLVVHLQGLFAQCAHCMEILSSYDNVFFSIGEASAVV